MAITARALHALVANVCPINGIEFDDPANPATWRVTFTPEATAEQRSAAAQVLSDYAATPDARIMTALEEKMAGA